MSFTVDEFRAALGRMVDQLELQTGSRTEAFKVVARRCGQQPRALRRIVEGTVKMNGLHISLKIREAYRQLLKNKIAEFQADLAKLDAEDKVLDVWDFDLQIGDLREKFENIRKGLAA